MAKLIKPYKNKGTCLSTEPSDLQAVCRLAIDSLQRHGGQSAKYGNTEIERQRFLDDCVEYFQRLTDGNEDRESDKMLLPSVETLCVFLGISRTTLSAYAHRSEAWRETVDNVRNAIASAKMQLACNGRIPSIVAIFDLCNNYHYHNTSEFRLSTEPIEDTAEMPVISTSELERIASSHAEVPQLPTDIDLPD